ncbi:hypothetical protein ACTXT7_001171 [Hymenolepis weldensis]
MHRTTSHPTLNDHSPAETLIGRKSSTIHKTLLPKDSTFSSSSSCPMKTPVTGTAVYMRDHHVPYEVGVDEQTWVRRRDHFSPRYATQSLRLERVPWLASWVFSVSHLSPENYVTAEIQPNIQQNLPSEHSRQSPERFQVDPAFKNYDGELSSRGAE